VQEQAPKHPRQHPHRQEEPGVVTRFVQNCPLSCPFSRLLDATARSPVLPMLGMF
jgi:hypothetical protein